MPQTFKLGDLKIASVTVFKDRAEVTRTLEAKLDAGSNEIIVEELPVTVKEDTICVDTKGEIVIQEVQYRCKSLKEDEYPEKLRELKEKLNGLQRERQQVMDRKTALSRRMEALERMAAQNPPRIKEREETKEMANTIPYDAAALKKATEFFVLYEKEWSELSERIHKLNEELEEITKKQSKLEEIPMYQRIISRVMTVLLESDKKCNVALEIRYQVCGATWSPFYDIKVKTDKDGVERLKVIYQGIIKQTTGEDWTDTKLILSTADPANAAQLEQLGTLHIACRNTQKRKKKSEKALSQTVTTVTRAPVLMTANEAWQPLTGGAGGDGQEVPQVKETVTEEGAGEGVEGQRSFAAVFTIDRQAAVPSDSGDHKVTITTLQVKPKIIHKTIPRKNSYVYITALAINETQFPFLEGNAAIYYNNSFVSNSLMNRVDPGEKFSCNLGIDPSVVVDYRPYHQTASEVGPITKISRITHDQTTVVHNKKLREKVLLIVQEHLPKSSEERVQVILNSPKLAEANKPGEMTPGARLNAANNLEWTLLLEPGEKNELAVSYNIDHPVGEEIRFYTVNL